MKLNVRISGDARAQLRELVAWWRSNRPKAPQHLPREIRRTLLLLADAPNIGAPYAHRSGAAIRRLRLRRTPYHLFYEVDEPAGTLTVLAVWSGMREMGPPI